MPQKLPLNVPPKHRLANATKRPELRLLRKDVRPSRLITPLNSSIQTPCRVYQVVEIMEG